MRLHALLISALLLFASSALAQQRAKSCEQLKDEAVNRIAIVERSRQDIEKLFANLTTTALGLDRQLAQVRRELQLLKDAQAKAEQEKKEKVEKEAEADAVPEAPSEVEAGKAEPVKEEQTQ
jgi:TolA-binding protein